VDAVILLDRKKEELDWRSIPVLPTDERVMVVQAKATRLCRALMGQGVFSRVLLQQLHGVTAESVILCTESQTELEPLLRPYSVRAVVLPKHRRAKHVFPENPDTHRLARWASSVQGELEFDCLLTGGSAPLKAHAILLEPNGTRVAATSGSKSWGFGMWAGGHALFSATLASKKYGVAVAPLVLTQRDDHAIRAAVESLGVKATVIPD